MKPFSQIAAKDCARKTGILFDIDDTFSLQGKIPAEAYVALWDLHQAGFVVVPITGRPAGWCDHMARMWPIHGIVGENGAFYFYYDQGLGKLMRRFIFSPDEIADKLGKLKVIEQVVRRRVPRAGVSADQHYRLFDLAIDFCEDVPALSDDEITEICSIFQEYGATCKVSSIHVNGWFGSYNKLSTTKLFLEERLGLSWQKARDKFVFIGDSPNDEPMFEAFPLSIGVANIRTFADKMNHLPAYVTQAEGGLGFAEMARSIINKTSKNKEAVDAS